ncbi:STAS domain-containing protein [Cellulomonas sp. 179-A 4D5 NHS]|uniref:STAS domain-containing protein n=1 Tax=Cellulomonas sp. 179-A 4D5 NHS TaxID=3142378 RepID=UPI00399FB07F
MEGSELFLLGELPGAVDVHVTPSGVRIELRGEIDTVLSDDLDVAVQRVREHAMPVTVDASEVTFIDSTGASFFARLVRLPNAVAALELAPVVRDLLEITGIAAHLVVVPAGPQSTTA